MSEEILDLVDEQDRVIGQLSREEVYRQELHNFRAVHALVVNKEGKLWIPRRTASRRTSPNAFDFSVAGHVTSGETYDESFRRETAEELNLDIDTVVWRPLGKITLADGAFCVQMVYEIQSDQTPDFNPEDFSEGRWLFPREIIEAIERGNLETKGGLAFTIKKFYL